MGRAGSEPRFRGWGTKGEGFLPTGYRGPLGGSRRGPRGRPEGGKLPGRCSQCHGQGRVEAGSRTSNVAPLPPSEALPLGRVRLGPLLGLVPAADHGRAAAQQRQVFRAIRELPGPPGPWRATTFSRLTVSCRGLAQKTLCAPHLPPQGAERSPRALRGRQLPPPSPTPPLLPALRYWDP